MFYNNLWLIQNGKSIVNQTKRTVTHCMIIILNIKYYKINNENVDFVIGDGDSPSLIYCHLWDLFLKKWMVLCWMWLINVVFLQLPAKEGFPVIGVICHESAIYVTGDVSRESEAQGLLQIVSYLKARFRFLLVRWWFAFARPSRLQRSRSGLVASLADNWLICNLSVMHDF